MGKLTRIFEFCLGNRNSVPVLPRLPTLMSNPVSASRINLNGKDCLDPGLSVRLSVNIFVHFLFRARSHILLGGIE